MQATKVDSLKKEIREKVVDIWNNPDNPPEDKLIEILEFTVEQIVSYIDTRTD